MAQIQDRSSGAKTSIYIVCVCVHVSLRLVRPLQNPSKIFSTAGFIRFTMQKQCQRGMAQCVYVYHFEWWALHPLFVCIDYYSASQPFMFDIPTEPNQMS